MNINDTPEQAEFRAEVRAWIDNTVPESVKGLRQGIIQGPGLPADKMAALETALEKKGWLAPHWPKEFGGAGFDISRMVIFREECNRSGVPDRHTIALDMLGPILIQYANDEQKERFLGPALRGEVKWAQGYSEPNSGSDLASLMLPATVSEDGFTLNGQKIWTSGAHEADWIFILCRTNPTPSKKQDGITFVLADMRSPGISTRQIITIDGFHHFNEVFFENVFVPKENMVGELHKGWRVAKSLLSHERFLHPTSDPYRLSKALENLKDAARETQNGEGCVWDDPRLKIEVAQMEMDIDCMRYTRYRALTRVQSGAEPGPETMIFKLMGAELLQRIIDLHQLVLGPLGTVWDGSSLPWLPENGEPAKHAANIRAATIRGGTSEVQRNIIAKRVLNLPD